MAKDSPLDRHFHRRLKAAKAGLHLPSEEELLRGMNDRREGWSRPSSGPGSGSKHGNEAAPAKPIGGD